VAEERPGRGLRKVCLPDGYSLVLRQRINDPARLSANVETYRMNSDAFELEEEVELTFPQERGRVVRDAVFSSVADEVVKMAGLDPAPSFQDG
jgi:hypothetical protein